MVQREFVSKFNKIEFVATPEIHLISSWRMTCEIDLINTILDNAGFKYRIKDSVRKDLDKKEAIEDYIKSNNVEKHIVIDDEIHDYPERRLLKTTKGLSDGDLKVLKDKIFNELFVMFI